MIPISLRRIAELTGGALHDVDLPGVRIVGPVVTDSRDAQDGSLYIARIGEHADGHDFAASAVAAGAFAVLGSRPVAGVRTIVVAAQPGQQLPEGSPDADPVQRAFAAIAREVAHAAVIGGLQIVGITGSSGKTSTKDLLGQVLSAFGPTVAPVGSYNSEVGLPLTVCRVDAQTRYLIAEMGASGVGHIRYLTSIAPPRIGIVLNVGSAHVGEFGSVENIARAKAELVQALPAADHGGLAILNADDPRVAAMSEQTAARVLTVGTHDGADLRAHDIELDSGRPSFTLSGTLPTPGGDRQLGMRVRLGLHGVHQVGNSLAVIAAASALGVPARTIAEQLSVARPVSRWRMEVFELPTGVTLVNDAYNANPESMAAALRALAELGRQLIGGRRRRSIAVLGEMRELGAGSATAHRAVGELASELGIDRVVAIGDGAAAIADGFAGADRVVDVAAAEALLAGLLTAGDVVLFKSSRDSGLRYLGDRVAVAGGAELP